MEIGSELALWDGCDEFFARICSRFARKFGESSSLQRAMQVELALRGVEVEAGARIDVHYKGRLVGEYCADLFAQGYVITEPRGAEKYNAADEAQLLNELKATGI